MLPYFSDKFYNPSASYNMSREIAKDLQFARAKVAAMLGAKPSEIIFTAGGTEANNLAIHGVMRQFPGANLAVPMIEHEAILEPSDQYKTKKIPVQKDGRIDPEAVRRAVDDKTVLVSIMQANNEIGTVQPLKKIAAVLEEIKKTRRQTGNKLPLYFHTDASQAGNYLDLHVSRLGVDLMTLNGGKIYGPKQTGALFVSSKVRLLPLIQGGGQERGLRSGTENVAGSVGFSVALELAQRMRKSETERLQRLQQLFIKILAEKIPAAVINGSLKHRLPNNIHITIPGADNERLITLLDEQGIMCAAGSACSASNTEASHVLKAIGLSESAARSSLRFTMGRGTKEEDIKLATEALAKSI